MKWCQVCGTAVRARILAAPANADSCATPHAGYFVNAADGVLTACSANCVACSDGSTCTACAPGTVLETTGNTCVGEPSCADYDLPSGANLAAASCKLCADGYFMDSTPACAACSTGCATCTTTGACVTASPGYRKGTADAPEACTLANCATCDADAATCTMCMTGYALFKPPTNAPDALATMCISTSQTELTSFVSTIFTDHCFKQIASVVTLSLAALFTRF